MSWFTFPLLTPDFPSLHYNCSLLVHSPSRLFHSPSCLWSPYDDLGLCPCHCCYLASGYISQGFPKYSYQTPRFFSYPLPTRMCTQSPTCLSLCLLLVLVSLLTDCLICARPWAECSESKWKKIAALAVLPEETKFSQFLRWDYIGLCAKWCGAD